jgi:hypothetical protein
VILAALAWHGRVHLLLVLLLLRLQLLLLETVGLLPTGSWGCMHATVVVPTVRQWAPIAVHPRALMGRQLVRPACLPTSLPSHC